MLKTVIFLGDSASGKSSLLGRLTNNHYGKDEYAITHSVDFKQLNDGARCLQCWDTGAFVADFMLRTYCRHKSLYLLLYDIEKKKDFESISTWYKKINDFSPIGWGDSNRILVATKCEPGSSLASTLAEALKKAKECDCLAIVETSSKNDINIQSLKNTMFDIAWPGITLFDSKFIYVYTSERPNIRRCFNRESLKEVDDVCQAIMQRPSPTPSPSPTPLPEPTLIESRIRYKSAKTYYKEILPIEHSFCEFCLKRRINTLMRPCMCKYSCDECIKKTANKHCIKCWCLEDL